MHYLVSLSFFSFHQLDMRPTGKMIMQVKLYGQLEGEMGSQLTTLDTIISLCIDQCTCKYTWIPKSLSVKLLSGIEGTCIELFKVL